MEYRTDIDYCLAAKENGTINGKYVAKKACLDKIPTNGFYRYKTSPNMFGEWIIAGEIKVNRVMSDVEAMEICRRNGVEPLPRKHMLDFSAYGFAV